jgi:hypothetical protein
MAYIRGHFYIYSDGNSFHFHHGHGQPFEIGGREFRGEDETGSMDDNTFCPFEPGRHPDGNYVSLPVYIVEEFVAMHWVRMTPPEREAAIARVRQKYVGGNFGADAVAEQHGDETVMDHVVKMMENLDSTT